MERFVANGARYEGDRLIAIRIGIATSDDQLPTWTRNPVLVPVAEVVNKLSHRDVIFTRFPAPGGFVSGSRLQIKVLPGGDETVEVDEEVPGRMVQDLERC